MTYQFKHLICQMQSNIMIITINRPDVLNALNTEVFCELNDLFSSMQNDKQVRVAILTGSGTKSFAAGSDVLEMAQCTLIEAREFALRVNQAQQKIANFPKPIIAAVNGYAFGGGLELAMCCDVRIASLNAKFGQPEINLGIIPGGGGTQRLSRLIGEGPAKHLVFTGQTIDAHRAYELGLVTEVVSPDQLLVQAMKIAQSLIAKSPVALAFAKQAFNTGLDLDLANALKFEIELFAECFGTEDAKEGLDAFLIKRKPIFTGK